MKQVQYRFNRKLGRVFLDGEELTEVGEKLEIIVLWASQPIYGKPFKHLSAQDWIELTFLDKSGNWCHALLNSGTTGSLYPWIEYRKQLEAEGQLFSFITTVSFISVSNSAEYWAPEWYEYQFEGVRGKLGIEKRMRRIIEESPYKLESLLLT